MRLSDLGRTTRHFTVVALAYILLCAIGAVAEMKKIARTLKANTVKRRTLALAAIGNHLFRCATRMKIRTTVNQLIKLPT